MKVLLYVSPGNRIGERVEVLFKTYVPGDKLEICHSFKMLRKQLVKATDDFYIGVFLVADPEELNRIASIKSVPRHLRTFLILPDREGKTMATAHQLHPSMTHCVDSNLEKFAAALRRIVIQ
jgi:hypothetical protein